MSALPGRGRWVRPATPRLAPRPGTAAGPPPVGTPGGARLRLRSRRSEHLRTAGLAYLFVAPAVVLTAAFSLLPLVLLADRSLYAGNVFGTNLHFVGFSNYPATMSSGGAHALVVTAIYTVGFTVAVMALGLGLALLLNQRLPGLDRMRAPFIVPLVVPTVGLALIWGSLFAPQFGLVNRVLSALGLGDHDFISSPGLALFTVLTFGVWQFFGEAVILYLASLKSLPVDVLQAAEVDGAAAWQRFRYMSWPMLRRSTVLISVVTVLTGLQTFTQIQILTQGGPDGATTTALYYIYNENFVQNNTGNADAMGVILFLLSLAVTVSQVGLLGRSRREA
jgi:ABC-type sugar transport system permease subunit